MLTTDRVSAIFADARGVHADALRLLGAEDVRDAAGKAWCATKRATDGLVLARMGVEPEIASERSGGLSRLATEDSAVIPLQTRYLIKREYLYGTCFLMGVCIPADMAHECIRNTADYIGDAERLAGYAGGA